MTSAAPQRPLVLINSGAYVHLELSAEFGLLPPAFLPVGLGRLYELQARALAGLGELHLTLPASFDLPRADQERLEALGFVVLRTPDGLPLGAALLYALGLVGFSDRPLRILHGDTLLGDVDLGHDDAVAVAQGGDGYRWAQVQLGDDDKVRSVFRPDHERGAAAGPRLCGYFAFASAGRFAQRLSVAQGDFYDALNAHAREEQLQALVPGSWLDFGHVQTYFRSRRIVSTARAFNSLQIDELRVRKRSPTDEKKVRAEARWLQEVPATVTPFCARLLCEGEDERGYFYDTEYEYMPTLSELYVFGRLAPHAWTRVLQSCGAFIDASAAAPGPAPEGSPLQNLVVAKTEERLERYALQAGIDLDASNRFNGRPAPALRDCLNDIAAIVSGAVSHPSVMHGDFCFSNIFYSFRRARVRVIDPRGLTAAGSFSLYGDVQ